jgi:hypothetical protein
MIASKTKWTSRLQRYLQQGLTTCEKQTKTCFDTPQEYLSWYHITIKQKADNRVGRWWPRLAELRQSVG